MSDITMCKHVKLQLRVAQGSDDVQVVLTSRLRIILFSNISTTTFQVEKFYVREMKRIKLRAGFSNIQSLNMSTFGASKGF